MNVTLTMPRDAADQLADELAKHREILCELLGSLDETNEAKIAYRIGFIDYAIAALQKNNT